MFQELLADLNNSHALIAVAVSIVILLIKVLSMLGQVMEFHDKHFVEKRHRRLVALRKSSAGDDALGHYLDEAIKLEAFRLVSGIRASALKADALITLSKLGYWDAAQIRRMSRYLLVRPEKPAPEVEIDIFDTVSAWYGLLAGGLLVILGALGAVTFAAKVPGYGFFVGVAFFGAMIFAGGWLAMDFGRYRVALRVQEYLKAHPETFGNRDVAAITVST